MKINETMTLDPGEGLLVHRTTHDLEPVLDEARLLRDADKARMGESRLVGVIDPAMWEMWARDAGLSFSDPDLTAKMRDVVKRKLLSGEFAHLRVWQGRY